METLFCKFDSFQLKENQKKKILGEIDGIAESEILNSTLEQWCDHIESKYRLDVPILDETSIQGDVQDAQVDARQFPNHHVWDTSRPAMVAGTEVSFFVPFSGEAELFRCKTGSYTPNPPRANVGNGELSFVYQRGDHDSAAAKSQFDRDIGSIRGYLNSLRNDLDEFNRSIRGIAQSRLQQRFDKLKKDQQMAAGLGVPLRKRPGAPATYAAPSVKRKIVSRPVATQTRAQIEPALLPEEYEHILSVMRNMVTVIERSPTAFKGMDEEHLRQHFLVQLNGQYEGQATGETFNFSGKTDILIRHENKNIFIAECKFWKGPAVFKETIDQLLGYTSWRDTKTAIVVFNRNKDLSNVLRQIPDLVKTHPNYLRDGQKSSIETEFRFVLHHNDDRAREFQLAVQVYEIPV